MRFIEILTIAGISLAYMKKKRSFMKEKTLPYITILLSEVVLKYFVTCHFFQHRIRHVLYNIMHALL